MESCKQIDVCNQKFGNIDVKIDGVEKNIKEKISVANHRIDDLEEKCVEFGTINNMLARFEVLINLQREDSIKRDIAIQNLNNSQVEITNTLKILTESINRTDRSVEKLDKKVDKNNEEFKKRFDEIAKENAIKIPDVIKYIFMLCVGGVVTYGLTFVFK